MRKSILAIVFGSIIMASNTPTMAAEIQQDAVVENMESEAPRMTNITKAECTLVISTMGNASVVCKVKGTRENVTRTVITANLQRYQNGQWVTVKTFSKDNDSYVTTVSENYQVSKGYIYRVSANVRAYTSSSSEGRTIVSQEVTY